MYVLRVFLVVYTERPVNNDAEINRPNDKEIGKYDKLTDVKNEIKSELKENDNSKTESETGNTKMSKLLEKIERLEAELVSLKQQIKIE